MHAYLAFLALLSLGLSFASRAMADGCLVPGGPFVNGDQFPAGGNTNAYYWVDLVAENRNATVRFVGDGPSNLPDPLFIAHVGETNRVVLLVGKTYDVLSAASLHYAGASGDKVHVQGNRSKMHSVSDYRFSISHPVTISFVSNAKGGKQRSVKATILKNPDNTKRTESATERRRRLRMQREAVRSEAARQLARRLKRADKWKDSPEQLQRRAGSPQRWFLESDAKWKGSLKDDRGIRHTVPVVNTNAALYGFCGCSFGSLAPYPGEKYVKQTPHFWGFPWIRINTSPGSEVYAGCDARMTFRAEGHSSVPAQKMKAMRDFFASRYGVDFLVESEGPDWFVAEGLADDEYHVGVYATNYVDSSSSPSAIVYDVGFEVVNELCVTRSDEERIEFDANIWRNALHVTNISAYDLENVFAWQYTVTKGKSTEELLDEWIRTGDDGPLKVPGQKYKLGTPVNDGYFCLEWEADKISSFSKDGGFYKVPSREEQQRICAKVYFPSFFRPRKPGEHHHYREGEYIGEILPGDTLTWNDDDGNLREGIVCDADEEGELVNKFGYRIRTTKITEMARPCDYLPSQASSNYIAAAKSVHKLQSECDSEIRRLFPDRESITTNTTGFCNLVGMYLAKLHEQVRPGRHLAGFYNVLEIPTRKAAQRVVKHREHQDLVSWQRAINDAIDHIIDYYLRRVFRNKRTDPQNNPWKEGSIVLTDDLCRKMGLSAYERKLVEDDWHNPRAKRLGIERPGLRTDITAPYLPAVGKPPENYPLQGFIVADLSDVPRVIKTIETMEDKTHLDVAFAAWTAAETIISLEMSQEEKENAMASLALALAKRCSPQVCAWITWRLLFEHGDVSILPWTFLRETAAFGSQNGFHGDTTQLSFDEDEEGRVKNVEVKESEIFLKWAAKMLSSKALQEILGRESEEDAKAWRERLGATGFMRK